MNNVINNNGNDINITAIPYIILVRPQLPENVGGTARVMYNFGFSKLRLVAPRVDFPDQEKAIACACGGASILKAAEIFLNLEEAVADLNYLYATTARRRDLEKICLNSREIPKEPELTASTGIIFGPENSGLSNEDLGLIDKITYINTENNPLNLVQAVTIICYEFYEFFNNLQAMKKEATILKNSYKPLLANKKQLQFFYNLLEKELEEKNFFQTSEKQADMMQNIQAMFSRANLSSQETSTLIGIISVLKRKEKEENKIKIKKEGNNVE